MLSSKVMDTVNIHVVGIGINLGGRAEKSVKILKPLALPPWQASPPEPRKKRTTPLGTLGGLADPFDPPPLQRQESGPLPHLCEFCSAKFVILKNDFFCRGGRGSLAPPPKHSS